MNLSAENIGAIRELVRSGYPLKARDAKDLLGHNDHLVELLEARSRLMLGVEIERDQLRAEVAGLKTGYEAYERVNAELKVECGALCDELKNLRSDKAQLIYALKQEEQNYLALRTERDRFKTDNEALRDDVEQNQYDANAWRNSEESVWIEVFNSEGDDPFISAITGQITVEQLALIQAEILEYREDYFEKGSGLYVFRCAHYQAHHDNVGMTEPAHWETDFESYSPFPWEEEAAAMGQGEQS